MAQYDVYRADGTSDDVPFVVDIQSDILRDLATRVVIPLFRQGSFAPIADLNPVVTVSGERHVLVTQQIGAVPLTTLKTRAGSLAGDWHRISRAVEALLSGV